MDTILFACTHNAGRSQMAAAFLNQLADRTRAIAISAGTEPAECVHPVVATVMHEVGIDISHAQPQLLTPDVARSATLLVTMGCGESCPFVPGLQVVDWALPDPKDKSLDEVRAIRDEVKRLVAELVLSRGFAG